MGTCLGLPIKRGYRILESILGFLYLAKLPYAKIPRTPLLGCGLRE